MNCQHCREPFAIEPEDRAFYEKIGVPAPTFCPACRAVRRMTWRNERTLYKRACAATGKDVITMFAPETPLTVYDRDYWWGDGWDQLASGREYDFSRPFFTQFRELLERAPLPSLANSNTVNSPYGNHNADIKNCYLTYASFDNQDCSYCYGIVKVRDSLDLYVAVDSQRSYDSTLCGTINNVQFSYDTDDSLDSAFLRSCKNLSNCLGCVNLRNASYRIFNRQYSKEDYARERERYDLGSYEQLEKLRQSFAEFALAFPRRFAAIIKSVGCSGDNIMNSKNARECYDLYGDIEDSKFAVHAWGPMKDCYDGYGMGANAQLLYECIDTGIDAAANRFCAFTHHCNDVQYVYACHSSDSLFGCVGLRKKKYCILNRQYTKEEYEALVPKIRAHMDAMPYRDGQGREYRYGEFFPTELSPFAYNESIAQEYFPLAKEAIEAAGYRYRPEERKTHEVTVAGADLPDHVNDAPDSIVKEVIGCLHGGECNEKCTAAFRLTSEELEFYRQHRLAIPRLCPNCRHFRRLALRNPMRLWDGVCGCAGVASIDGKYRNTAAHPHGAAKCAAEFRTPYAPGRSEIVYCESCYQYEVA